ncbi:YaeQ family protein [Aquirhabdus sp.]|uniref:YaeQ family protein n=1 Tax=Aquirhabdus sp. TaxID=2824160 RepID=UPI00396C8A7B
MALKATIYKADLQIADMNRHYYETHSQTIARHPSETEERVMARVLMFGLYASESLSFTKGLFEVDEPDIWDKDLTDAIQLWVDVGQPDETRIKKASNRSKKVVVLSYNTSTDVWWKALENKIARLENVTILQLLPEASEALTALVTRSMRFSFTIQDDEILVSSDDGSVDVKLVVLKAGS